MRKHSMQVLCIHTDKPNQMKKKYNIIAYLHSVGMYNNICLHFDGIVGFRDRVQVGQIDRLQHGRGGLFLHDAAELDVETVDGHRRRIDGNGVGVRFPRGDGHDFGLRVPVVADIVGHGHATADGRGRVAHCRGAGNGGTAAAVVVDAAAGTAVVIVRAAIGRTAAVQTATAASRVSGVHTGAGDGGRGRQVANAAVAAASAVVASLMRIVAAAGRRGRLVQRFEFGGHAVVHDVEAHGR